jgi:regulator of protease activity HflC (stomatin/prohibitin superfamily)
LGGLFDRPSEFRLDVTSPDAFAMIGQLGVAALPIDTEGPGTLLISLSSDGITEPRLRFAFDGLETSLRLDAGLDGSADSGVSGLSGTGSVFIGNVAQNGLLAGMALPGLFDPVSASAGFDVAYNHEAQEAVLSSFVGEFADVPLAGDVTISQDPLGTHVDAQLEADRLDLRGLLAGFVGPGTFDLGFSEVWPEGPIAFNPMPVNLDLQLAAPRVAIWDNVTARDAQIALQAREGEVVLDQITGELYGGRLDGRLVMRDADRGTIATGRLALNDLDLAQVAWERSGRAVMQGDFSTSLSFETSGGSLSSLMSALTGDGTFALSDVTITGLGLDGFSRVLQASDAGLLDEEDDIEGAFADALSAGTMRVEAADNPITMVGGLARASNLYVDGQSTALRGGVTLDLSTGLVDADFSYAAVEGPGDVASMPNVGLSFVGPLAAPEQELDVSQMDSFLNVRQLELEIRRVETLNAEILERERLLRTMASIDLDLTRIEAERVEAERREAERLEAERLAEEARRAAEAQALEEEQRQALEQQRAEEEAQAAEAARIERERVLREALQAREAEQVLNLDLPALSEPITVNGLTVRSVDPLAIGENPPAATSAPLDLSPN